MLDQRQLADDVLAEAQEGAADPGGGEDAWAAKEKSQNEEGGG
jgi:hypothetical protein